MGFSSRESWSGLPFSASEDLPTSFISPALAGRFFTTGATWEAWVTSFIVLYFLGTPGFPSRAGGAHTALRHGQPPDTYPAFNSCIQSTPNLLPRIALPSIHVVWRTDSCACQGADTGWQEPSLRQVDQEHLLRLGGASLRLEDRNSSNFKLQMQRFRDLFCICLLVGPCPFFVTEMFSHH